MLNKVKGLESEKPKVFSIENSFPANLGSNFNGFERISFLTTEGKTLVRYKNTGSFVISNIMEKDPLTNSKTIRNNSQIVCISADRSLLVSCHDNDTIQIVHIDSLECEKFEKDLSKKTQAILINPERIFFVNTSSIIVYDCNVGSTVPPFVKKSPKEFPLKDSKDDKTRVIINVKEEFSFVLSSNRLLLGNADVFQIWDLDMEKCEMSMSFEGRNSSSQIKFYNIFCCEDTVVTTNRNTFLLWDISKPPTAGRNPKEFSEKSLITAVFLDDTFLLVADSEGNISFRQARDGQLFHYLNPPSVTSTPKEEGLLLEFQLENKVNDLHKLGRYVIVGCENSKLSIFDVMKEKSDPILEYVHTKGGSIRPFLTSKDKILFPIKSQRIDKNENLAIVPDVGVWNPKLPGFAYFWEIGLTLPSSKRIPSKSAIERSRALMSLPWCSYYQISSCLQEIGKQGEDVTEFTAIIERLEQLLKFLSRRDLITSLVETVSFLTLKNLQKSLDEYEHLLSELTQTGRLQRFFSSSRLRRNIEFQNNALHRNLTAVEEIIKVAVQEATKAEELGEQRRTGILRTLSKTEVISKPALNNSNSNSLFQSPFSNRMPPFRTPSQDTIQHNGTVPDAITTGSNTSQMPSNVPSKTSDLSPGPITISQSPLYGTIGITDNNTITFVSSGRTNALYGTMIASRHSMIADVDGRSFWSKYFGHEQLMVEWSLFIEKMRNEFQSRLTPKLAIQLQSILDHGDTGYVSQYKFSEFLKGFGPFSSCVENVFLILNEPWFHGFLSSRESELLFKVSWETDGSYLVRFSKSKPGSFALAFVKGNQVKHILIESNMPEGFRISEQEANRNSRVFKSLYEIIQFYNFVLRKPFTDPVTQQPWFHGDLSTEEANELLSDQQCGTFLLRFSRKACYAASFVDSKCVVRHVLIVSPSKGVFEIDNGNSDTNQFQSIPDLVSFYGQKGVFKFPMRTTNRL